MIALMSRERLRRSLPSLAFALLLLVLALVFREQLRAWFTGESLAESTAVTSVAASNDATLASKSEGDPIHHYTCSMHPSVHQQGPGKCPICGMDLIPVSKTQQEQGVVMIDEARRQLIGVRVGTVAEAPWQRTLQSRGSRHV
ncbi:MAG: heavy metal-binding domain-containing protein [Deltaproteobacteria bacterium]